MKTKNKNLLYLALIFALILAFCGALVLSVYTAEKIAFAEEEPTYTQFIQYFGSCVPYDNASWYKYANVTVTPHNEYFSLSFSGTSGNVLRANNSYDFVSGHKYCFFYHIGDTAYTSLSFRGSLGSSSLQLSVVGGSLMSSNFTIHSDGISAENIILYSSSSFSNLPVYTIGLIDITLLGLNTLSVSELPNYIDPYHISKTNTFFNNAYWSNVSYENGYNFGYDDGFGEGVILTRAQSYETKLSDFQYGTSSYAYNARGILQPYDDGYNFLNIGWADMFPLATFNSLKKVRQFQVSCVMDIYTYTEDYDPYGDPQYTYSTPSIFQENVLLKTNANEFHSDGERIISYCYFPFLDHPDISNNMLLEFIVYPHSVTLNFVDTYEYGSNVWPKTWFAVGAKNSASDYLYTFDVLPIDSSTSYELGYNAGISYADGRVNGSSASYVSGYNHGVESVGNYTFPSVISAAIDIPVQTARNLLNFDFFGTNLNSFVLSLLSFGIVVAVIKLILGR